MSIRFTEDFYDFSNSYFIFQGGVKAVVWTDTLQFIFTVGSLVTVLILGGIAVGGIEEAWKIAEGGGRIKFFEQVSQYRHKTKIKYFRKIKISYIILTYFSICTNLL